MNVKIFKYFAFAAIVAVAASQARAATVLPLLKNGNNSWEDDDYESLVADGGTPLLIDVGDRFAGVFRVSAINTTGVASAGDPTITAVFAIECLSKTYDTGSAATATTVTLGFGPLQGGGGNDAIAQWAGLGVIGALGSLPTIKSDDTTAIFYDFPDWDDADETVGIGAFDDSNGGVPIAEFGFTSASYSTTTHRTALDEFWRTVGQMNADPDFVLADLDTDEPLDIAAMLQGGIGPNNLISLNVTWMYPYPITFNPHSAVFPALQATDLQATGVFVQASQQPPGLFALATDTDLVVNLSGIVPEPASWLVFTGLFGAAVVARRRRRKS